MLYTGLSVLFFILCSMYSPGEKGGSIQSQEDKRLVGLLLGTAMVWGRVEEAVVAVVILGGEDEGCEPAGFGLVSFALLD